MAEPIEMPFGLWAWMGPKNHVLERGSRSPRRKGNPIVKYRDTLWSSVQKRLNRSRCRLACWLGRAVGIVLDGAPAVLRDVAIATNFGTQFAITGFVGYNFVCMMASDKLF